MQFGNFQQPTMGMGGYMYNPQMIQQQPKVMNVLTDEEIKTLQQTANQFSLGLTEKESLQAVCNHRKADGSEDSLVYDQLTGIARCTICGYEFRPVDENTSIDDIRDLCDKTVDILQTIKLLYTDLPANAAREYFQIIPLIKKIPQLFEFAAKNFAKHEFNSWQYNNQNMGGIAMLQNLAAAFGAGQPMMMGQPAMQPMGQPMMGGVQPMMGQPMTMGQPAVNPFGFPGASQPMNQGFAYQPGQVQPQVAPTVPTPAPAAAPAEATAPAAAPTETVQAKVTV